MRDGPPVWNASDAILISCEEHLPAAVAVVVPVVPVPIVAHNPVVPDAARRGAIVMVSAPPEGLGWCRADGLDARKRANGNHQNHKRFHLPPPEVAFIA